MIPSKQVAVRVAILFVVRINNALTRFGAVIGFEAAEPAMRVMANGEDPAEKKKEKIQSAVIQQIKRSVKMYTTRGRRWQCSELKKNPPRTAQLLFHILKIKTFSNLAARKFQQFLT